MNQALVVVVALVDRNGLQDTPADVDRPHHSIPFYRRYLVAAAVPVLRTAAVAAAVLAQRIEVAVPVLHTAAVVLAVRTAAAVLEVPLVVPELVVPELVVLEPQELEVLLALSQQLVLMHQMQPMLRVRLRHCQEVLVVHLGMTLCSQSL